ncbi:DNA-directed RNA polymerase V subunit 5A-like [Chenopodium quinoa]|uniref:DNA-directed RNA polymerase V subunit 5A-like n=1 Tax=Chenopodium quinoa TaxID=63459 RepID=UPI000B78ADC3|nr:DNA-directed RNA polymerase V subunit 5A-like [Chenopodium quinoa]
MEIDGEINGEAVGRCLSSFVDDGTTESHRYYLARRTTLEMLKDRGYAIPSSEIDQSLHEFRTIFGPIPDPDRLRITSFLASDPSKTIMVIFCGPQLVKVNSIRGIGAQIVNKEGLNGLILILQSKITSQAQKAVDEYPFKVEIFQITDLLVNITKHVLKPKHQVLTPREKEKLLKKYNLEEKQLPRISAKDAIVRHYGYEKGQVLKVTYSGEITQSHVTYRCVS